MSQNCNGKGSLHNELDTKISQKNKNSKLFNVQYDDSNFVCGMLKVESGPKSPKTVISKNKRFPFRNLASGCLLWCTRTYETMLPLSEMVHWVHGGF